MTQPWQWISSAGAEEAQARFPLLSLNDAAKAYYLAQPTNIRTERPVDTRPCPIYDRLKAELNERN